MKTDASTIASDNSFKCEFAKCGFTDDQIEISHKVEFDLPNQSSLDVCANIYSIIGDVNGDSGTIRSNLSAATIATSQSVLPKTINYLTPIPTLPSSPPSTKQTPPATTGTSTNTISMVDAQESSLTPEKSISVEEVPSNVLV